MDVTARQRMGFTPRRNECTGGAARQECAQAVKEQKGGSATPGGMSWRRLTPETLYSAVKVLPERTPEAEREKEGRTAEPMVAEPWSWMLKLGMTAGAGPEKLHCMGKDETT